METITMTIVSASRAALVPSADLAGDAICAVTDRGRAIAAAEPTPFVVDPRPAGPAV